MVTVYASVSAFASLIGITMASKSSEVGLIFSAITAGIKKYKSINKKKREKDMIK